MTHTMYSSCAVVLFLVVFQTICISGLPKPRDGFGEKSSEVFFDTDSFGSSGSIKFGEASPARFQASEPEIIRGTRRSEGCHNLAQNLQRFDKKARKCSQIGIKSHCGENMIFYSHNNSKAYGQCDCDYTSRVPLIYHVKTDRCYFIYQQGYCKEQEWLEMNPNNGKSFCSSNKCFDAGRTAFGSLPLASRDTVPEYVPLDGNGQCVKLNQPYRKCGSDEQVTFSWPSQIYAKCNAPAVQLKHLSIGSTLRCSPGSYLTLFGRCQSAFDFD